MMGMAYLSKACIKNMPLFQQILCGNSGIFMLACLLLLICFPRFRPVYAVSRLLLR